MAFLDKLSDLGKTVAQNATEIGKSVAQKSGEIAESGKISVNIRKKEKDIRMLQLEIGKYVYQQFKNGQSFDTKIQTLCEEIDVNYEEISALELERQNIGAEDAQAEDMATMEEIEIEVVDADVDDTEIDLSDEDKEILDNL